MLKRIPPRFLQLLPSKIMLPPILLVSRSSYNWIRPGASISFLTCSPMPVPISNLPGRPSNPLPSLILLVPRDYLHRSHPHRRDNHHSRPTLHQALLEDRLQVPLKESASPVAWWGCSASLRRRACCERFLSLPFVDTFGSWILFRFAHLLLNLISPFTLRVPAFLDLKYTER
jgi:hypothetical protein